MRLRNRRRRASAVRRARGWKSGQKGRWRRICDRDGWVCWLCGDPIDQALLPPHQKSGSADHVVALAKGGSDDDENLRAAHLGCNCRRGAGKFAGVETAA